MTPSPLLLTPDGRSMASEAVGEREGPTPAFDRGFAQYSPLDYAVQALTRRADPLLAACLELADGQ